MPNPFDFTDEPEERPERRSRRESPPRGRFACPYCGSQLPPRHVSKISSAGWGLFVVMMIFLVTILFCWIPLIFMREQYRTCADCGSRLG